MLLFASIETSAGPEHTVHYFSLQSALPDPAKSNLKRAVVATVYVDPGLT
jgi:hypothetical protein